MQPAEELWERPGKALSSYVRFLWTLCARRPKLISSCSDGVKKCSAEIKVNSSGEWRLQK